MAGCEMSDQPQFKVSTSGYMPSGRKMFFEATAYGEMDLIILAKALDSALTEAGLTVREVGVEAGEQVETIHYIVARTKVNTDGTETPVIDLYPEKFTYRFLSVYLNTQDDKQAFVDATGITPNTITVYESDSPLERGKNTAKDAKYLVALPSPVQVIWKLNPLYDENSDAKKPKKLFVRWHGQNSIPAKRGGDGHPRMGGHSDAHTGDLQRIGEAEAELFPEDVVFSEITVSKVNKSHLIQTISEPSAYTYTREPFRLAGVECEQWATVGRYKLDTAYSAEVKRDSAGKLQIQKVKIAEDVPF